MIHFPFSRPPFKNNDNVVAEAFCVTIDAAFDNGSSYTKVYDVEFDTLGNNPAGVNDPRKEQIARIMYAYMNDKATLVSKLGTASFKDAGVYIGTQMAIHNVLDQDYQRFNDNHDIGSVNALMTYLVGVANNADAPKSDLIYLKPNDTANSQSLVLAKEIPGITMVDEDAEEKTVPTVATTAKNADGNKIIKHAAGQTIVDTVKLTDLADGVTYTLTGELRKKDGSEFGKEVTATCEPITFTTAGVSADGQAV